MSIQNSDDCADFVKELRSMATAMDQAADMAQAVVGQHPKVAAKFAEAAAFRRVASLLCAELPIATLEKHGLSSHE